MSENTEYTVEKLKKAIFNMSGAMFLDIYEQEAWNYIASFVEYIIDKHEDDLK